MLRRNDSLICFDEAISYGTGRFQEQKKREFEAQKTNMNHQFLNRNDFAEFVQARDVVMHLYPEAPEFDEYFRRRETFRPSFSTTSPR